MYIFIHTFELLFIQISYQFDFSKAIIHHNTSELFRISRRQIYKLKLIFKLISYLFFHI